MLLTKTFSSFTIEPITEVVVIEYKVIQERTLKQPIENSNIKNRLAETQKANEVLKRMLSHMPTVKVKHKLVVQQRINRQMAKKLKTLAAERSLDEVELNVRQCTLKKYVEQLNGMRELALTYATNTDGVEIGNNILMANDEEIKIMTIEKQNFIESDPYSEA
ncbi:uncharacterized protein LOC115769144, partial [Drosophila novamexicana]|uniref:uncharacterized protein LOC115769144 n=1 Tax=Drosophila novamexicana TaxID=47314 RepID=UPI0011E5AFFF